MEELNNINFLTIEAVAKKYSLKPRSVRYAIRQGVLKGYKFGWIWLFREDDLPDEWPLRKNSPSIKE